MAINIMKICIGRTLHAFLQHMQEWTRIGAKDPCVEDRSQDCSNSGTRYYSQKSLSNQCVVSIYLAELEFKATPLL